MRFYLKYFFTTFLMAWFAYTPKTHATENITSQPIVIQSPTDYADTPWAAWNIPAGTKLYTSTSKSGKVLHRLEFTGGVTMSELEEGGRLDMDTSKTGAVLCAWEIHTSTKARLDKCHPEETVVSKNLDLAVQKMKAFIIANSLTPITDEELDASIQKKRDQIQCPENDDWVEKGIKKLKEKPELMEEFQKSIDKGLAIPRPPVLNPCL